MADAEDQRLAREMKELVAGLDKSKYELKRNPYSSTGVTKIKHERQGKVPGQAASEQVPGGTVVVAAARLD